MENAESQTFALVKLDGREPAVTSVFHFQAAITDLVAMLLNATVMLVGLVHFVTLQFVMDATMGTVLLPMNVFAQTVGPGLTALNVSQCKVVSMAFAMVIHIPVSV